MSFLVTLSEDEMGLPSAPVNRGPEVAAEDLWEKTETQHLRQRETIDWKPNPEDRWRHRGHWVSGRGGRVFCLAAWSIAVKSFHILLVIVEAQLTVVVEPLDLSNLFRKKTKNE